MHATPSQHTLNYACKSLPTKLEQATPSWAKVHTEPNRGTAEINRNLPNQGSKTAHWKVTKPHRHQTQTNTNNNNSDQIKHTWPMELYERAPKTVAWQVNHNATNNHRRNRYINKQRYTLDATIDQQRRTQHTHTHTHTHTQGTTTRTNNKPNKN